MDEIDKPDEYCCDDIECFFEDDQEKGTLIKYDPMTRYYSMILTNNPRGDYQQFGFCPFCGTELPNSLSDEWEEIVRREAGLTDDEFSLLFSPCPDGEKATNKLPEEFKTDTWWKKRGL